MVKYMREHERIGIGALKGGDVSLGRPTIPGPQIMSTLGGSGCDELSEVFIDGGLEEEIGVQVTQEQGQR